MKGFLPAPALTLTGIRWFGLDLAKRESQLAVLDEKGLLVAALQAPHAHALPIFSPKILPGSSLV